MSFKITLAMGCIVLFLVHAAEAKFSQKEVDELQKLQETTRKWALICPDGSMSHGHCPLGDNVIFAGISCLAGVQERCKDVKDSQGKDGRWWRSPGLVDLETEDSFSRDQFLGVLSYFVVSKDSQAFLKWMEWSKKNNYRLCKKSSDTRCILVPAAFQLLKGVYRHLNLKPPTLFKAIPNLDPLVLNIEPLFNKGYTIHLNAIAFWLYAKMKGWDQETKRPIPRMWRSVVGTLVRRQPNNPFFLYLKGVYTDDSEALFHSAAMTLDRCPKELPPLEAGLDWAWQRHESDQTWRKSSGHDCIFMSQLLLQWNQDQKNKSEAKNALH